jgi:hypothetical protein
MAQSVLIGTARFSRDQYSVPDSVRSRFGGIRIPRGFLVEKKLDLAID